MPRKGPAPEVQAAWKEEMLTHYRESGHITSSCERVGIPRSRHERWLLSDPEYREAMEIVTLERQAEGLKTGRATGTGRPVDEERKRERQDALLTAFAETHWLKPAGAKSGVEFTQHFRWIKSDPEYADRFRTLLAQVRLDRKKNPYRKWTPESREKASESAKARWAKMGPAEREPILTSIAKANRGIRGGHHITKPEAGVMTYLTEAEVPYLVHKPQGPYTLDIYVPSLRLDIEADGAYYHDGRNADREAVRDAYLTEQGVTVLRLSEAEIKARDFSRLSTYLSPA
jgi:hypothetical protein